MVWNENGSQPGSWGHGWNWLEALQNPRIEFVVGVHPWLENDIPFSDLILPAQTNYEHEDLVAVQRSDVLAMFYQDQAIEPVGDSKSDYEIHRMIGQRLGLDEAFPPADDWLKAAYEGTLVSTKHGIGWEEFKEKKYFVYDCPTWDEWVEIKKEHGCGPNVGGLQWFWLAGDGLDTPSGKIEFVSSRIAELDPENTERPPLAKWMPHSELQGSARAKTYPLTVMSNHPRFRFHVQGDDIDWIREIAKVRGSDGYLYEPCWIHPIDAEARGISDGDVITVHNERGAVLAGAVVTERIIPGALSIDHGAKMDLAMMNNRRIDRGGCINLISPTPQEKYGAGAEIVVPEMNVSGFLVEAEKTNVSDIVASTGIGHGATVPD
jgi:trimethylamine-N-oxide reductase (cytochrome c)